MTQTTKPPGRTTVALEYYLQRLDAGDPAALNLLTARAYERVRVIAQRQLRRFPGLTRHVETQDVLHDALAKLTDRLRDRRPDSARDFFRWASRQIRAQLIDLLRHHYGRQDDRRNGSEGENGRGRRGAPLSLDDLKESGLQPASDTFDAVRVEQMAEFHQAVAELPDDDREVFDLLFYHGLTQDQAAQLIGVSERTVRTRWQRSRRKLAAHVPADLDIEREMADRA